MSIQPSAQQAFNSLIPVYNQALSNKEFHLSPSPECREHGSLAWYVDHLYRTLEPDAVQKKIRDLTAKLEQIRTSADGVERTKQTRDLMREEVYTTYYEVLKGEVARQKTEPPLTQEEALEQAQEKGELEDLLFKLQIDHNACYASADFSNVMMWFEACKVPKGGTFSSSNPPKVTFLDGTEGYSFSLVDRCLLPMWYWRSLRP